jgi:hypothetical protein
MRALAFSAVLVAIASAGLYTAITYSASQDSKPASFSERFAPGAEARLAA